MNLIEEWKQAWRYWSVKLNAIGLAIMGYLWFEPAAVLYVVNLMPPAVRQLLPFHIEAFIGATFFALAMVSRLVKQPKARAKIAEDSNG